MHFLKFLVTPRRSLTNSVTKPPRHDYSKLLLFLMLSLLIEKKYFQFYCYFYCYFKWHNFSFINKNFLYFLILQLTHDLELNSYILHGGLIFSFTGVFRKAFKFQNLRSLNTLHFSAQSKFNKYTLFSSSVTNVYNSLVYIDLDFNYYLYHYFNLFFSQAPTRVDINSYFSYFSFKYSTRRVFILNYFLVKKLFHRFVLLLLNTSLLNMIPCFVYPPYLEKEVLYFYSYFIFLKTSLIYSLGNVKHVILLKNLHNFKRNFGMPSFFFVLDMNSAFKGLSTIHSYKLPVGGLVTSNMPSHSYDYPLFINSWSKEITYAYFIFIIHLFFSGLQKRKQFLWHFYIKNQILYELKKRLVILN